LRIFRGLLGSSFEEKKSASPERWAYDLGTYGSLEVCRRTSTPSSTMYPMYRLSPYGSWQQKKVKKEKRKEMLNGQWR